MGILWSFERVFVKTPSGRNRFNVLGALHAVTHEIVTVTNDSYITAQSVIDLLYKLKSQYFDLPITLILDNARYQKCQIVREAADFLNIELLYLPPYSPNLNLIERLWRYVKKECLNSKYHKTFAEFKTVIMDCLNSTDVKHQQDLSTLLTQKFQMFPKTILPEPRKSKRPKKSKKIEEKAA